MARSKLTAEDQQELLRLYQETEIASSALADQFQVSVSTVARILKENIPAAAYQELVNQKRSAGRRKEEVEAEPSLLSMISLVAPDPVEIEIPFPAPEPDPIVEIVPDPMLSELPITIEEPPVGEADPLELVVPDPIEVEPQWELEPAPELIAEVESELDEEDEEEEDLDDLDDDLELDEDLEEDALELSDDSDEDEDPAAPVLASTLEPDPILQVLSLDDLDPPRVCYVVIDKFQELTTRPLKEFISVDPDDLEHSGLTPAEAAEAKTLPIFDNHRVARRFSEMIKRGGNQPFRVMQFSGRLLSIVRTHLQGKGITHLLLDGRVYSL